MKDKRKPPRESPYEVTGADLEARRTQRLNTVRLLKTGRTALHVIQLAEDAVHTAEDAVASAMQREPPNPPSACAEGCAWCCYQRIGAAAPEIIRIAEHIRHEFSPVQIAALLERIHHHLEQRRVQRRHLGLPCPLLENNRCSVYAVRPLTCRGFNSSDPLQCERKVTEKARVEAPMYAPQHRLNTMVLDGLRAGAKEAGLFNESLDLAAALQLALREPDTADQWLAGEPVFAPARLT